MKILFIAPSAYLLGGVQDWLMQLVPALRKKGLEVVIAVPDGRKHDYKAYVKCFPELNAIAFSNPTGSKWGRVRSLYKLVKKQSPDIVVGVNIGDLYTSISELRRRCNFGGHVVMTIHAIEEDYLSDLHAQISVIDSVIATNRLTCELAHCKALMPKERIFYAPYGVPIDTGQTFQVRPDELLRFAWVGRFDQSQKRIQDICAILEQLDLYSIRYKLSLAGDGPERQRVEDSLRPWMLTGKAEVLGRLDKKRLQADVFTTHHALLITSSWETGPIVAWEAMAAGMAVVSSAYVGSGLEGALVHGETALIFQIGDTRAAARELSRLRDPELHQRLANQGRAMVRSRYSREASTKAWAAALESVGSLPPLPRTSGRASFLPAGRLDRLVGIPTADTLRRLFGVGLEHTTPGSEWPHAISKMENNNLLLSEAASLDHHV